MDAARGRSFPRVWGAVGAACALCGVVAYVSMAEPARASSVALYVPQLAAPKVQMPNVATPIEPQAQVPQVTVPGAPQLEEMPSMRVPQPEMQTISGMQVAEVPSDASAQPTAQESSSPLAFLGGFAAGFAVAGAFVYSLVRRTGQKISVEGKKLELGALTSVAVESPSPAGAPNSLAVVSQTPAPYLAGGASLPVVLKQVMSGRTAMPALGRQLRAINIGQGRRVVVNMKVQDQFAYGLPGASGLFMTGGAKELWGEFDPANFLQKNDGSLKDKLEVYKLREAELTHGRVAMLASLGFVVQENYHPLFPGAFGTAGEQAAQLPVWLWFVVIGGCGIAEAQRVGVGWAILNGSSREEAEQKKANAYPGDLGWDPLGIKPEDPAEFRLMQEKELQHCRLAMLATTGFISQELASKATWGAYWAQP